MRRGNDNNNNDRGVWCWKSKGMPVVKNVETRESICTTTNYR